MNPNPTPIEAIEAFSSQLPPGAKILGSDDMPRSWFEARGIEIAPLCPAGKDLRFLSPARSQSDGIWAGRALASYSIEDVQRIAAIFFQTLKPKTGALFLIHAFAPEALASMLRQNGFKIRIQAQNGAEQALVCQRI